MKNTYRLLTTCILFLLLFQYASHMYGQGWELRFNDEISMIAHDVIEADDHFYILSQTKTIDETYQIQIVVTDLDGNI